MTEKANTRKIAWLSAVVLSIIAGSVLMAGGFGQFGNLAAADEDDEEVELIAILFDGNGSEAGEVKYEAEEDEEESELKIEIKDFVSNGVFVAFTNSTQVGLIATDSDGEGELKFEPSPITINRGDSITVENSTGTVLSGTFESDIDEDDDEEEEEE